MKEMSHQLVSDAKAPKTPPSDCKAASIRSLVVVLACVLLLPGGVVFAQDTNVEISKSRLEELERKEKELDSLKGDLNKTKDENRQLKEQKEQAVKTSPVAPLTRPVVTYTNAPITTLPALQPDSIVESMDVAEYYRADAASADQRFRKKKFLVRGEIVGFEKPLLMRNYRILLKAPDGDIRVICDFLPPEKSNAVFASDHGSKLVAQYGESRVVLAKLGQVVQVKGECHGLSGHEVMIYGWQMSIVQ